MACIQQLNLTNFRNFKMFHMEPSKHFNIIIGENGSGKTSLLESIYLLGLGRSFRTHLLDRVVHHGEEQLVVYADVSLKDTVSALAVEKTKGESKQCRLDGESNPSQVLIAATLPMQFISTSSYDYFIQGPTVRRQFMDWALFHVKREAFLPAWQRYQRALKQRNIALKQRVSVVELAAWDLELSEPGEIIHNEREAFITDFLPALQRMLGQVLPQYELELRYQRGWRQGDTLLDVLSGSHQHDLKMGYTASGVHRADCQLYCDGIPADDVLSQGQLKVASYALYLSQAMYVDNLSENAIVYLIDDLPSELDVHRREALKIALSNINSQVFVTGISNNDVNQLLELTSAKSIDLSAVPTLA